MAQTPEMSSTPAKQLEGVRARIAAAARSAGRDAADVELIAVSKTFEAPGILPVLQAGHLLFGENRVQEAKQKWPALKAQFPDTKLHLVGPLQSNKVKEAVELFDAIHAIDRVKIARAIAAEMTKQAKRLQLFVQVNTGEEPQKAGVSPKEAAAFVAMCRDDLKLDIAGLMCIPPVDEEPAVHFALLAKLADELSIKGLSMGLSMGMSDDFETAIEFGATHVRVGSAIFGMRTTT
jgi:pyridoxal phosphate enzyme (YggS family)